MVTSPKTSKNENSSSLDSENKEQNPGMQSLAPPQFKLTANPIQQKSDPGSGMSEAVSELSQEKEGQEGAPIQAKLATNSTVFKKEATQSGFWIFKKKISPDEIVAALELYEQASTPYDSYQSLVDVQKSITSFLLKYPEHKKTERINALKEEVGQELRVLAPQLINDSISLSPTYENYKKLLADRRYEALLGAKIYDSLLLTYFHEALAKLDPAGFQVVVGELEGIADVVEKNSFLGALPGNLVGAFTSLIPPKERKKGDKTLEEELEGSDNAEASKQALLELKVIQGNDKSGRLTDGLIELLVWGVAKRTRAGSDFGKEGLIGIHQAVNCADVLIKMKLHFYLDIIGKLTLTGDPKNPKSDKQVESVLILKAVTARKTQYLAENTDAEKQIDGFADTIRGMDADKLKEVTTVTDKGDGNGLQQKFTMSCAPTSIQILHGEADPIYAMDINKNGKHDLDYKSTVANEQKTLLNKTVLPRKVQQDWKAFKGKVNGLTISPTDLPKWTALLNWIKGVPFDAVKLAEGKVLANGQGTTNDQLDTFKTYFPFDEPGLNFTECDDLAKSANEVTNTTFAPGKYDNATKKLDDAGLDKLWEQLFRGVDVKVVVLWTAGGGHAMAFTSCKGTPPKGGKAREFLLSDPWEGTNVWLTSDKLKAGNFGAFGNGYVHSLYY